MLQEEHKDRVRYPPSSCSIMAPHYDITFFKSKGIIIILLWSFTAAYIFHKSVLEGLTIQEPTKYTIIIRASFTGGILFYPILGWLADARCGRYSVVKYSLFFMWAFSVLQCLLQVILDWMNLDHPLHNCSIIIIAVLIIIATGGVQANIIQFGIDQISDAPSAEIASFLRWYGWVYFVGQSAAGLTVQCSGTDKNYCFDHGSYTSLYAFVDPALLSIMLMIDIFCSYCLLKESEYKNPFQVIFKVLKYAYKNRYPKLRGSMYYWDKKLSSRLDLAKSRFGGPFTTDEVESVKAFFRMVLLISIGSIFVSTIIFIDNVADKMILHFFDSKSTNMTSCNISDCYWRVFVSDFGINFIVVVFPLSEIMVRPWINKWKHFQRVSLPLKFAIGMLFLFVAVVIYGSLDTIAHTLPQNAHHKNVCVLNLTNDFYSYNSETLYLPFQWIMLPSVIYYIGNYIMIVTGGQFICAQSPSFMKGLLFGMIYGTIGLSIALNSPWLYFIQEPMQRWSSATNTVGCGTVYFMTLAGFLLIVIVVFTIATKCYKNTKRGFDDSSGISFFEYDSNF